MTSIVLINSISNRPLIAQTLERTQVPRPEHPKIETPNLLPPPVDLLQTPLATPPSTEEFPTKIPGTITVEIFEFVGSTVFSTEQLAEVTNPFTKRPLSFAELLQARSAVTQLYVKNGYVTSGAYIPPQTLENGVVRIEIVEGSLEAINVNVSGRLNSKYVRDRIALATEKPLNVTRLLEALKLLQLDPLLQKVSAELSAGSRSGTSVLDVEVDTARSFSIQATLDNGRVPSVGSFERILQVSEANLLGYGDGLTAIYTNTDGSNELNLAYAVPVNPRNGKARLGFRTISSTVIEPPFNQLDIESDYQKYELMLRQPVIQTPTQELAIGITFDYQDSSTSLEDIPFPLSPGANSQGKTKVSSLRFFQEWTQRGEQEVFAARSEFNLGLDIFGATEAFNSEVDANVPDTVYFAWRGQAQWVRLLAPDTLLVARTDMQLADRSLVSLEQFALGGLGSVEGYRQDLLLTDNGLFASVELRIPIFRAPKQDIVLQIIPFVDFGTGWNTGNPNPDPQSLASVGLGLQFRHSDRLSARIDWGIPLIEADSRDRTWQENGLYFSVIYKPF